METKEASPAHFQEFMRLREKAAKAYVVGNPAPLEQLTTARSPATFFGPQGGTLTGAPEVAETYRRDAAAFDDGSETRFEILHAEAGDRVAFWTGIQHATVRFRGRAEAVPMSLRVTEVFRREGEAWKLVHRHADPLSQPAAKRN